MAHVLGKQGWCGLPLHFTGDQPKKINAFIQKHCKKN